MHVHICAACTCVCLTSEQEAVMSSLMYEGEVGKTEVSPNTCIKGMTLGKEDADADTGALASPTEKLDSPKAGGLKLIDGVLIDHERDDFLPRAMSAAS